MQTTTIYLSMALATLCCVYAEEHHKRAPSGFTGVRGKKSIPDSAYSDIVDNAERLPNAVKAAVDDASDATVVEKRAPSGFMGMRGKKPSYTYIQPWEGTYPDGLYKRAPSGFVGMRGKKDMETVGYDTFLKRAPSGFVGMRGKKDFDDYYNEKRGPMGFVGMRGKKLYEDSELVEDKRAPSGFFGMRGKKQPARQSGFFGMRGKKYPYEFRGKFVGVRGKKLSNEITGPDYYSNSIDDDDMKFQRLGEDLDLNQLMLLLTEQNEADEAWNREHSDSLASL